MQVQATWPENRYWRPRLNHSLCQNSNWSQYSFAANQNGQLLPVIENLNSRAKSICDAVASNSALLDVQALRMENGAMVIDMATNRVGTFSAGIELARICMADLAHVSIDAPVADTPWPRVKVVTDHPLQACIASQYAGWAFSTESYFSMCSGPARLAKGGEEILEEYDLRTREDTVVGVFEASSVPSKDDVREFAEKCGCQPSDVTLCVARTASLPGSIQVVARSVETAMHKLFEIGFDLKRIERAVGFAPIPPIGTDDYQAMGWTNDSVLYGSEVHLWISNADDVYSLADQLPSCTSSDYGRPFAEIFEENNRDFYKVDRMLFSPAMVTLNCIATGRSVTTGRLRNDLLRTSFDWKND